ncbi:hypothetical protein [Asanoa siamensis]|uniref:hypothetical protein n=1 Tax=Asanoa siamensis TaxID=926357 RepID=UPI001942F194|nr:hypothetical protein [Asanoa siamensis]
MDLVLLENIEAGERTDCRRVNDYDGDLLAGFTPLDRLLPPQPWTAVWHASRDILLKRHGDFFMISARTDEALAEFRVAHPGEWLGDRAE